MTQTTTVRFAAAGAPDVLQMQSIDIPKPGPGEICIKVEVIGMNYAESLYRMGFYIYPPKADSGLGYEAVGVVEEIGEGVYNVEVGQRISTIPAFKMDEYGVYGKHAIVPAFAAAPYIDTLTAAENAAIWMSYTTAYGGLIHYGKLKKGDFVVVTPATGGVGLAALQIAKSVGAISIATTRSPAKAALLREAGADHVIVTGEADLEAALAEITDGKGVDLIFNAMTGSIVTQLAAATALGGTFIQYGGIGQQDTLLPYVELITKGVNMRGYTLFELTYHPENMPAIIDYVSNGVKEGYFKPQIDRSFAFDEITEAAAYIEAGDLTGKVVVTV